MNPLVEIFITNANNKCCRIVSRRGTELLGSLTQDTCQHLYAAGAGLEVTRVRLISCHLFIMFTAPYRFFDFRQLPTWHVAELNCSNSGARCRFKPSDCHTLKRPFSIFMESCFSDAGRVGVRWSGPGIHYAGAHERFR